MKRTTFQMIQAWLLAAVLLFSQVGAALLHNDHDAHDRVVTKVDNHSTVLLPHGEHCKVCAVDCEHPFVDIGPTVVHQLFDDQFPLPQSFLSLADREQPSSIGRAPPIDLRLRI